MAIGLECGEYFRLGSLIKLRVQLVDRVMHNPSRRLREIARGLISLNEFFPELLRLGSFDVVCDESVHLSGPGLGFPHGRVVLKLYI